MKKLCIFLLPLLMASCTLDTTALLQAETQKDQLHYRMLDVWKELVTNSNMSEIQKTKLLVAIEADRGKYTEAAKATLAHIEALGKIDETKLTAEALAIYKQIKGL